jgi:hypothetical protein
MEKPIKYKCLSKKHLKLMSFAYWCMLQLDGIDKEKALKKLGFFGTNAETTAFYDSFESECESYIAIVKELRTKGKKTKKFHPPIQPLEETRIQEPEPRECIVDGCRRIEDPYASVLLREEACFCTQLDNKKDCESETSEDYFITIKTLIKGEWVLKSEHGDLYDIHTHEFLRNMYDDDDD